MIGKLRKIKKYSEEKHWVHWQWYKSLFSIVIFRYFVTFFSIIPLLAKLLSQVPSKFKLTIGEEIYNVNLTLPFSWELLWVSAFLYTLSYVLYLVFCPRFIKTYNSYSEYNSHGHSPRWLVWLAKDIVNDKHQVSKFFERMNEKKYLNNENIHSKDENLPRVSVENKQTTLRFLFSGKVYKFSMPILNNQKEIDSSATSTADKEIFWEIFGRFASSKFGIRITIMFLLSISTILFSFVLIQNILEALFFILNL